MVHKWRSEEDAIMVGTNTAHYDDPKLNVRHWNGRDPVRVVIDRQLRLNKKLNLFDQSQPTFCFNAIKSHKVDNLEYVQLASDNFLGQLMEDLATKGMLSVMVEGGATLLQKLIDEDLWDEIRLFQSPGVFQQGISAPQFSGHLVDQLAVRDDVLNFYLNK